MLAVMLTDLFSNNKVQRQVTSHMTYTAHCIL